MQTQLNISTRQVTGAILYYMNEVHDVLDYITGESIKKFQIRRLLDLLKDLRDRHTERLPVLLAVFSSNVHPNAINRSSVQLARQHCTYSIALFS